MDPNGRMLKELTKFVEEQRRANEEQRRANEEQRRANARYEGSIEALRYEHKAMDRRWQKMFLDHEKWMRSHEVRLGSHYRLIQEIRDKLR